MLDLINDEKYFVSAVQLLEGQIKFNSKSKLYLLNFDFFFQKYNRNIFKKDKNIFSFYEKKIKGNEFYSLENDFFIYKYVVPKWLFGLRDYTFFSYESYLLYYAVGLYIHEISQVILSYKQELINSLRVSGLFYSTYSWTKIAYNNDKICVWFNVFKYHNHYNNFYKEIKRASRYGWKNKIIIKLDIQNFFGEIKIEILLDFLKWNINNQILLWFNDSMKDEILDFFQYLWFGEWIPQSDDNIISNHLSDLYLLKSDFKIIDFLKENNITFSFLRYVDDTYIIFEEDWWKYSKNPVLLLQKLWDIIYKEVKLKLNTWKNAIYRVYSDSEWESFIKNIKNISQVSYVVDEDDDWLVDDKINDVFSIIWELKNMWKQEENGVLNYSNININKLNNVFSKEKEWENILNNILKNYTDDLKSSFKWFNFHYINLSHKALLAIIKGTKGWANGIGIIYEDFIKFINRININTIYDIFIILEFLVNDKNIFNKKELSIINMEYSFLKHFHLKKRSVSANKWWNYQRLGLNSEVIEQIKYRLICEKNHDYSKAFSHLLNEFHNIIYFLDKNSRSSADKKIRALKKYDQKDVKSYLFWLWCIDNSVIIEIGNFFDRRNKNNISHWSWVSLDSEEYFKYRKIIFSLYKRILP